MLRPRLVAVVLLAVAASGCSGDEPEPEAEPTSTPLAALDTGAITVTRGEFCSQVPSTAVEDALGGPSASDAGYDNGETAELAAGVTDVAHEYGCGWSAADGTTARAWVFAPPVTAGQANRLQAAATHAEGCTPLPDAPRFGARSAALRCAGDPGVVASYRGLFGDAWLSCSLGVPAESADLVERAERWCATVVQAAGQD